MSEPVFTIANQLTLLRMALAPVLVVCVLSRQPGWALAAFVLAGLTDAFDGFFARRGGQQTTLGAMLDPVADKILLGSTYVVLTWSAVPCAIPVWVTVTLLSRDAITIVSVAVINLTVGRRVFAPSLLGKVTTAAQILTAGLVLLANALGHCPAYLAWTFRTLVLLIVVSAVHYTFFATVRPAEPGPS